MIQDNEQGEGASLRDRATAAEPVVSALRDGIPSAYGEPVWTLEELEELDGDDVVEGYRDGFTGEPEPKGNRSRSYWHGWRNGAVDSGHIASDAAQQLLAKAYVKRSRGGAA